MEKEPSKKKAREFGDLTDSEPNEIQKLVQERWTMGLEVKGFLNNEGVSPKYIVFRAKSMRDSQLSIVPLEISEVWGFQFGSWQFGFKSDEEVSILTGKIHDILYGREEEKIFIDLRFLPKQDQYCFTGSKSGNDRSMAGKIENLYFGDVIRVIY